MCDVLQLKMRERVREIREREIRKRKREERERGSALKNKARF